MLQFIIQRFVLILSGHPRTYIGQFMTPKERRDNICI